MVDKKSIQAKLICEFPSSWYLYLLLEPTNHKNFSLEAEKLTGAAPSRESNNDIDDSDSWEIH